MLAVLAARICRDETLTEEEKLKRLRALYSCWEQLKDKKRDLIYYDSLRQAYEGKEVKQRVIDKKEMSEFIQEVSKEYDELFALILNSVK